MFSVADGALTCTLRHYTSFHHLVTLAPKVLGTVSLYLYFHQSKVSEVAKDANGVPLAGHDKVKASGRGADLPVATDDVAGKPKGAYHTESDLAGAATLIYPHLERSERMNLENLTVPRNEGAFGRTMKQAAVRDRMKKDRDADEHLKEPKEPLYGEEPRKV